MNKNAYKSVNLKMKNSSELANNYCDEQVHRTSTSDNKRYKIPLHAQSVDQNYTSVDIAAPKYHPLRIF